MKRNRIHRACAWASLIASLALGLAAHALELPPILESAAGRFVLSELGAARLSPELESRLAADLESVRARLAEQGADPALFAAAPGARALTEAEQGLVRQAFVEQAEGVRDFLGLGRRAGSFAANRESFLTGPPLPRGNSILYLSQRPDLLDGMIYRIELRHGGGGIDDAPDLFEQGAVDTMVRRYPHELDGVGVRAVETDPLTTVVDVPGIEALNARVRLRGWGFTYELAPSEEALPIVPYLRAVAGRRIPVAPVGATARMFSHDLMVHALAITAFMPAATVDDLVAEAQAMLDVYQSPEVQGSPALKDYVKSVMRARVIQFDRQTAQIMVIASQRGPQRFENLSVLFAEMGGGRSRARARLLNPSPDTDAPLGAADRQVLERLLK